MELLNTLKELLYKFMDFFALLKTYKKCSQEIKSSIFKTKTRVFYCILFDGFFF